MTALATVVTIVGLALVDGWRAIPGLAVMLAAYLVIGRKSLSQAEPYRLDIVFAVLTVVAVIWMTYEVDDLANWMILAAPWLWLVTRLAGRGVFANCMLFSGIFLARVISGTEVVEAAWYCSGRLIVSLLIGIWFSRAVEQWYRHSAAPPRSLAQLAAEQEEEYFSEESETTLTEREREVLVLIAQGMTNIQVAEELHLSAHTVKTHVEHIFAKLGVSNRTGASSRAKELGWI
jgi:DNA-binding CsgD family transcriptional regulator